MITRIYEGTNQTERVVIATRCECPGQIRLTYATPNQIGVDIGGRIDPVSPYCSMSYISDIDLLAPRRLRA